MTDWHAKPWVATSNRRGSEHAPRRDDCQTKSERDRTAHTSISWRATLRRDFELLLNLRTVPFRLVPVRVLILRFLSLPRLPSSRNWRRGRPLDVLGHRSAARAEAGVLGRRGAHSSQLQPDFGGRGAWVGTNIMVRDMDLVATVSPRQWELGMLMDSHCSTVVSWRSTPH